MNKKYIILAFLVIFLVMTVNLFAGASKLGTAGAIQLTIPMGARSIGMGGSNIANVENTEAIYWNPAGVAQIRTAEASFSYLNYFADMKLYYITTAVNIGKFGILGFSLQSFDIGDIEVTTNEQPEGTGAVLSPSNITLGLTYAYKLTNRIAFGLNTKLVTEQLGSMVGRAIVWDFGLQYRTEYNIDFGLTLKNLGTKLQYDGSEIEFNSEIPYADPGATTRKTKLDLAAHEMPTSFGMGLAYRYEVNEENKLNFVGQYANNAFGIDQMLMGVEYGYQEMVFLRAGYDLPLFPSDYEQEYIDDYQFGMTLGAGVNVSMGDNLLIIDYAYRDMKDFDPIHYFTFGFGF